jgi:hypothetical protein
VSVFQKEFFGKVFKHKFKKKIKFTKRHYLFYSMNYYIHSFHYNFGANPGAKSFDAKLTIALHTVVPCVLCTVHLQHKINGNIHRSGVSQLNFAGNCTVMATI